MLERATPLELLTLVARVFGGGPGSVNRHRHVRGLSGVDTARVVSTDGRDFPVQLDGDFIGEIGELHYGVAPRSLTVVS